MNAEIACTLILFGYTGIAIGLFVLAMPRHHTILLGTPPSARHCRAMRMGAWFILLTSLMIALAMWNGGITLILWFALLAFHSFSATLIVTYAARHWRISMLVAVLTLALGLIGTTGFTLPSHVAGAEHTERQNASSR